MKRISFATDLVDVMEDDSLVEEEEEEKTRHWSTSLFRGSKRDSEDLAEEIANVKRGGGGGNSNSNSNKTLGSKNNGGGGIINVDNSFSSEDIDVSKMFENEDTENSGGTDTAGIQRFTPGGSIAGAVSIPTRHIHQVIEMADKTDIQNAIDLLLFSVKELDQFDWSF